jgi:hypothetical protein
LAVASGEMIQVNLQLHFHIYHFWIVDNQQQHIPSSNKFNNIPSFVQIYNDAHIGHATQPYLMYRCDGLVTDVQFCPYEDVLGVGHTKGC